MAVRDGRIVAVGADAALRRWIGPRTRVIDLRGRTVTPGFGDAHVHPVTSGLDRLRCDLTGRRGLPAYLAVIAAYAAAHPDAAWILGSGWSMADFPGGIADRAGPRPDRRPIGRSSSRVATGTRRWVNSRALELAGITATTADPATAGSSATPTGRRSGRSRRAPRPRRAAPAGRRRPRSSGGPAARPGLPPFARDHELAGRDRRARAEERAYVDAGRPRRADGAGRRRAVVGRDAWRRADRGAGRAARGHGRGARYRADQRKLMQDGVLENFTGACSSRTSAATAGRPATAAISLIDPEALRASSPRLDALGLPAHFHAIGDRAVRESLDAVEAARRANGPSDTRPHIAHIQVIHPDDIARFRGARRRRQRPGPTGPCHEDQMDVLTIPFLGPERAAWQYPFALAAARRCDARDGLRLERLDRRSAAPRSRSRSTGQRRASRRASRPFLPDERIDLDGRARGVHARLGLGQPPRGRARARSRSASPADLAVLDRDLFDRGAGAIGEARVVATFVGGDAVHEAPALEG